MNTRVPQTERLSEDVASYLALSLSNNETAFGGWIDLLVTAGKSLHNFYPEALKL